MEYLYCFLVGLIIFWIADFCLLIIKKISDFFSEGFFVFVGIVFMVMGFVAHFLARIFLNIVVISFFVIDINSWLKIFVFSAGVAYAAIGPKIMERVSKSN